jgi:hypothetical protein
MEQIFGASLSMVGVTFSSKAQYTNNTKLTWTGQSRGSSAKRLAAGSADDWPVADDRPEHRT